MKRRFLQAAGVGLIVLALLLMAAGAIYLWLLPEVYEAVARIRVERDSSDVQGLALTNAGAAFDPYWIQTEFEAIQSKLVLYRVVTNLNLNQKWAAKFKEPGELRMDLTYSLLKRQLDIKLDIRQTRGSGLIEIHVFSEDRHEAAAIANEIAKVYREQRLATELEMKQGGVEMLKRALREQNEKLETAKQLVERLRAELNTSDAVNAGKQQAYATALQDLENLEALRRKLERRITQELVDQFGHKLGPVQLVDLAEPPSRPIRPNPAVAAYLFTVGLLVGVAGLLVLSARRKAAF